MKKSTLAAAMLLSMCIGASASSQALTINVTTMEFYTATGAPGFGFGGLNTSVVGSFNDLGTGTINSGPTPFFGTPWSAVQGAWFDGNTIGSPNVKQNWSGAAGTGPFNYDFWLTGNQVAVGMLFTWGSSVDIAVLQVFDCPDVASPNAACVSINKDFKHPSVPGSEMDNGPFTGQHATFKGTTSDLMPTVVPVPAAVWLFGSGLLGLVGVARRKKA